MPCRLAVFALTAPILCAGCESRDDPEPTVLVQDDSDESDVVVVGVLPEKFECQSVAPEDELTSILGEYREIDPRYEPVPGVARPCAYLVPGDGASAGWSFDIDCRKRAIDDGKALMVQYANHQDTHPVRVGHSGIDYRQHALLFLDDDTPCYARVLGPDEGTRLALAKLIADNLDAETAPTSLRYQRRGESSDAP